MHFVNLLSTTAQNDNVDGISNSIIGIGGILATIIVGIVTCIVTWKLTLRSTEQKKLSYSIKILNVFSNSIQKQYGAIADLSITYDNKKLKKPCLLLLEVENTGNKAIANPPISVRTRPNTEIIPMYFQDVPVGYDDKWDMKRESTNCCKLCLEHINPKQTVKVSFLLDTYPEKVLFECPMQNVLIHERNNSIEDKYSNNMEIVRHKKITTLLFTLSILIFISMDYIIRFLYHFFPEPYPFTIVLFILCTLVSSVILNIFEINRLDKLILKSKKNCIITFSSIIFISIFLLCLIINDILITNYLIQFFIALLVSVMIAYLIHILSYWKCTKE